MEEDGARARKFRRYEATDVQQKRVAVPVDERRSLQKSATARFNQTLIQSESFLKKLFTQSVFSIKIQNKIK